MNQRLKILRLALITHHQAAEILQPGIRPLDDPPPLVAPQLAPILMRRHPIILALRDERLNLPLNQHCPRWVAVISAVANQALRFVWSPPRATPLLYLHLVERLLKEFDFRRGSLLHVYSERSTRAIGQYHKLRSLAALSFADFGAPFFALTNMPSIKHSFQRTFFWSLSWSKKARHKFNRMSLSAHSLKRRWTALLEPYRAGNSLQGAPVQRIHKMPSKHLRSSVGGRPPLGFGFRFGSCFAINSHCLSVTARQAIRFYFDLVRRYSQIICHPVSG